MGKFSVNVALVAVFAALISAFALMPPLFAVGAVPFAVQIIIILLAPLVLGPWQGTLANLLYVVAGLAGLPVFAKQTAGVAALLGPTGGYLIGYLVAAPVVGCIASAVLRRRSAGTVATVGLSAAALAGVLAIHACGVLGLMLNGRLAFGSAVIATSPFVPIDMAKAVIAAVVCLSIVKAFPRVLRQRG